MRKSIKVRLAVSFIGITLLSLLSITAVNRLFLEKYYISRKADSLETVYKALNEQAFNDPEGRTHLQGLCIEKNISWVLVDVSSQDWTIIANDGRNPDLLATRLLFGYIWGMMPENREVISANDSYVSGYVGRDGKPKLRVSDSYAHGEYPGQCGNLQYVLRLYRASRDYDKQRDHLVYEQADHKASFGTD